MTDHSKNRKYLKILATARDLFWKHGFRRVSVEEICKEAQVSKMTYYRFFPNKIELAKAVFDQVVDDGIEKFRKVLLEGTTSAEKIRKIILLKTDSTSNISKEFLNDFYNDRELGLKEYIEEKTRHSWSEILKDFRHAQERGWFRSDMKPEFLFYFSQKVGEMLSDQKLLSLYDSPHELIVEMTNFFSYGISPKRE